MIFAYNWCTPDICMQTEFQNRIMQKFANEIQTIALKTNRNSDIWRTGRSILETMVEIGGVSPYDTRLSEALLASAELEQVDTSGLDALGMSPTGVISWYLQYHSPDSSLVTDNDLSDVQQMQIGALDTVTKENPRHVWYAYQRHGFNRHRPDPKPHTLT